MAERDMMEQFQMMMDTYQIQRKRLENRKAWVSNDRTWHGPFKDEPPSEMTVTHVNQTKDLYASYRLVVCNYSICLIFIDVFVQ